MNGPSVKEFDPIKAVFQQYLHSKTARHMHGHKRQNENSKVWNSSPPFPHTHTHTHTHIRVCYFVWHECAWSSCLHFSYV